MRHEDALCSPRGEGLASRRRPNGCSSHAHVYFVCFMHGTPASKEFENPECQSRTCILTFVHTTVFFLKCPSVGWASIFLLATRLQFLGSQLNSEYHGCVTKNSSQFWRVLYRRKRVWECTCLYSECSEFVTFFYKQIASKEVVGRLRGLSNCLLRTWCVMQMVEMRVCASQPWGA